ncbi:hypothetical protein M5X17_27420 [Paenibacillus alvei]|uniref:hypothetical protein n=1 Tax=Paenibacillus alvei TaxID=44250 RepID=UPI00227E2901|nr:hypothetical protein [Paenibacillus alvei]MCY9737435.1 hypothetical protein [Paenibacillus alvei]
MNEQLIKLCLDTSRGRVANFSADQASEAIRKEFIELLGTDKPDYRTFRNHKNEIFQILEIVLDELITDGVTKSDFFDQFVEYRDLNLGDTNIFYVEDRSMLTISEIADGHLDLRRQKLNVGQSFTIDTRVYGAKVYTDFLRFIAGRVDWAGLVAKIEEAVKEKMARDIYTSFMGASTYLPAEFKHKGTFADEEMSNLIQRVRTANKYAPVVIAGTKNALKKINGSYQGTSFLVSEDMKKQINQNGILNVYEGIPLMEIPQVFLPNTFEFALDDKKLLILPANTKPIKVVREGESIIMETDENKNMDMSKEYTFIHRYGIATVFNNAYGVYDLA